VRVALGYGLQKSFPDAASWQESALKIRMVAHPHLVRINAGFTGDFSILLSNNANTGGTASATRAGRTVPRARDKRYRV
jgi:hypothetical protein